MNDTNNDTPTTPVNVELEARFTVVDKELLRKAIAPSGQTDDRNITDLLLTWLSESARTLPGVELVGSVAWHPLFGAQEVQA